MKNSSPWWSSLPTTSFGSAGLETRLAALVLGGRKRATVWSAAEPNPTAPGMQWVVTADGAPVAIIETVSVDQKRFDEIDAAFALEEGEGDCSLDFWRAAHEAYFREHGGFEPGMLLWCERFRLIEAIDESLAAAAQAHAAAEVEESSALMAKWRADNLAARAFGKPALD